MPETEYLKLARQTAEICDRYQTPCVLHSFPGIALELGVKRLHLPLPILRHLSPDERAYFTVLGASCHSAEDAQEAETLGCTYITAGHVFDTDCKKGLPGRGLEFLKQVCESVKTPVYAIEMCIRDRSLDQMAEELEEEKEKLRPLYELAVKYPDRTAEELLELLEK